MDFFTQMIRPMWTAFTASLEMLDSDMSLRQKFDAVVSRIAHELNRAKMDAGTVTSPQQGPVCSSSSRNRYPRRHDG
jgi:hypothetical protein